MHIHVHIHQYGNSNIDNNFNKVFSSLNQIKMNTTEALEKIEAQTAQIQKIGGEVTAVKDALAAAIAAGNTVPAELEAAINGMGVEIQAVDDLNAD